jgi:hypothetical protein
MRGSRGIGIVGRANLFLWGGVIHPNIMQQRAQLIPRQASAAAWTICVYFRRSSNHAVG